MESGLTISPSLPAWVPWVHICTNMYMYVIIKRWWIWGGIMGVGGQSDGAKCSCFKSQNKNPVTRKIPKLIKKFWNLYPIPPSPELLVITVLLCVYSSTSHKWNLGGFLFAIGLCCLAWCPCFYREDIQISRGCNLVDTVFAWYSQSPAFRPQPQ